MIFKLCLFILCFWLIKCMPSPFTDRPQFNADFSGVNNGTAIGLKCLITLGEYDAPCMAQLNGFDPNPTTGEPIFNQTNCCYLKTYSTCLAGKAAQEGECKVVLQPMVSEIGGSFRTKCGALMDSCTTASPSSTA